MLFNSLSFLIFFAIVYMLYMVLPMKVRKYYLLIVSYIFYMCWNPKYIFLLIGTTLVTYICGLLIKRWGKLAVAASLIINFGLLFVFKYLDFAYETIGKITGLVGKNLPEFSSRLALPVGISFFIFQAVGYTIDVYRKDIEPEKNIVDYALFVAFFPQLVAGPIERSKKLLMQIKNLYKVNVWNFENIQTGFVTALFGFFMKMVIADRASIYVSKVFDVEAYANYGGFTVAIAIILFSIQIYCDFAGYTYIAIGIAKMMGIDLCVNFLQPYMSTSIKDFWGRWHISLSTYFRDYLYVPLGGSKKGKVRKYFNILIVFLLSGLWHGASWNYVIWGGIHGVGRVAEEMASKKCKNAALALEKHGFINTDVSSFRLFRRILSFAFVSLAWTFFRAPSARMAFDMIKNLFTEFNPWVITDGSLMNLGLSAWDWNILIFSIAILILVDILSYKGVKLTEYYAKQNGPFKLIFLFTTIMFIVLAGVYGPTYEATQFIYFQF